MESGKKAAAQLEREGLKVKVHQLDIDNAESIVAFAEFLKETYGGLDVLVNNAATFSTEVILNSETIYKKYAGYLFF